MKDSIKVLVSILSGLAIAFACFWGVNHIIDMLVGGLTGELKILVKIGLWVISVGAVSWISIFLGIFIGGIVLRILDK